MKLRRTDLRIPERWCPRWRATALLLTLAVSAVAGAQPPAGTGSRGPESRPVADAEESAPGLRIAAIEPTVFFVRKDGRLLQQARAVLVGSNRFADARMEVRLEGTEPVSTPLSVDGGRKAVMCYVPDIDRPTPVEFVLTAGGVEKGRRRMTWQPQRHWEVYLTPISHHDWGYTEPVEVVLRKYDSIYDDVLQFCDETSDWPEDSRFHYMVEGAWSIQHFIRNRPPEVVEKLGEYLRQGRVEVSALYGNEITGLLGDEEQIRLMYPSFELKRRFGAAIQTAHTTDIPGLSWGLPTLLSDAGVKYFFAGLPEYFRWEGRKIPAFWDESSILRHGRPDAFRWQGPDGGSVLVYYQGGYGCWSGRDYARAMAELPGELQEMEKDGSPFSVARYGCSGCTDNKWPSLVECRTARTWNDRWAYPRLIVATSSMFFAAIEKQCGDVRTFRGELPHTDYAVGAASSARQTGINRITHDRLPAAERFLTIATSLGFKDPSIPTDAVNDAYDQMLLFDEHTWGMAEPAGPQEEWDFSDKSHCAYKAAGVADWLLSAGTRAIAGDVALEHKGLHLVVFNPLSFDRTDVVRMSLRRWPESPERIRERKFDLVDDATGEKVAYQIAETVDPLAPSPYAAQHYALGNVTVKNPRNQARQRGELYDLVFVARDIPSVGYKTYRIVPREAAADAAPGVTVGERSLENRFFKLTLDPQTGGVASLFDKQLNRELVDAQAAHKLNQLVVRQVKDYSQQVPTDVRIRPGAAGPVSASLIVTGQAAGCPELTQEIVLYEGLRRIDFNNRVLKDSQPLMEVYFAFPFRVDSPQFRFEASNSVIRPFRDQFPGSNTHYYSVQHWAEVSDGVASVASVASPKASIILAPIEAHLMEFGGLWPCRVSQAHHGVTPPDFEKPFIGPDQVSRGHMYSFVLDSNFRTNFQPVQQGEMLFRYSLTTAQAESSPGRPAAGVSESRDFGWSAANPLIAVAVRGNKGGRLPRTMSFCRIQPANVLLLAMKPAEDGQGVILHLIETSGLKTTASISVSRGAGPAVAQAFRCSLVEEDREALPVEDNAVSVPLEPNGVAAVRLIEQPSPAAPGS